MVTVDSITKEVEEVSEMKKEILIVMMLLSFGLAGCLNGDESITKEVEEVSEPIVEEQLLSRFPDWQANDHNSTMWNSSMMEGEAWVAYFSAPWCAHCETTLDTYDQVIPNGKYVVFSNEDDPQYLNMSDWHQRTEENLNRSIDRPFIYIEKLGEDVGVQAIPHAIFINSEGFVYQIEVGKRTNQTMIGELWNNTVADS